MHSVQLQLQIPVSLQNQIVLLYPFRTPVTVLRPCLNSWRVVFAAVYLFLLCGDLHQEFQSDRRSASALLL